MDLLVLLRLGLALRVALVSCQEGSSEFLVVGVDYLSGEYYASIPNL